MKSVLVTGGTGLLGANLLLDWQEKFSLSSVQLEGKVKFDVEKQAAFDLADPARTLSFVKEANPDAIVHAAAMVNVDYCEKHREEAFKANAVATQNVAVAAAAVGAKMVYISTDSIFDGKKGHYNEEAKPNPLNVYAESKLAGEKASFEKSSNCAVVRTTIFGWNALQKQSFSEWVYFGLKQGKKMNLFKDMFFTPVIVNNLGRAIAELIERDFSGIINVAGRERLSRLSFGKKLADVFGLDKRNIVPSSIEDSDLAAARPKDASLDVKKASRLLATELLDAAASLREKKTLLETGYVEKLKAGIVG